MRRDDFKSDEEYQFHLWLLEAHEYGFISEWAYEPEAFVIHKQVECEEAIAMKTKRKYSPFKLFTNVDNVEYTPDFRFRLTRKGMALLSHQLRGCIFCNKDWIEYVCHVDVKGGFNPYKHSDETFFLKQRLMFDMHGIYVQKVVPKSFFRKCFAPDVMRWCKGRNVPTLTKLGMKAMSSKQFQEVNAWKLQEELDL